VLGRIIIGDRAMAVAQSIEEFDMPSNSEAL